MKYLFIAIITLLFSTNNNILFAADNSQNKLKTVQDYVAEGLQEYLKKDYDAAILCFLDAIKADSDNLEAHIKLGECYYYKKNYKAAIKMFLKAFDLNPNHEYAYNLATSYNADSDNLNAVKYFLKAIEYNPEDIRTTYDIGMYYYYKDDYDQAIRLIKKAIAIDLKNSKPSQFTDSLYKSLAQVYDEIGNAEEMNKCYQKICEIDSNYVRIQKLFQSMQDSFEVKNYIHEDFSSRNLSKNNWINESEYKWQIDSLDWKHPSEFKWQWENSTDEDYIWHIDSVKRDEKLKYFVSLDDVRRDGSRELFYVFKTDTTCFLSINQSSLENTVKFYIDGRQETKDIINYTLAKGNHIIRWELDEEFESIGFVIYDILVTSVHSPKIESFVVDYPFNVFFKSEAKVKITTQNPNDIAYYKLSRTDSSYTKYTEPFLHSEYVDDIYAYASGNGMTSLVANNYYRFPIAKRTNKIEILYPTNYPVQIRTSGLNNFEILGEIFYSISNFILPPPALAAGINNNGIITGYIGYNLLVTNLYFGFNSLKQPSFDMTAILPLHRISSGEIISLTGGYRYCEKKSDLFIGIGVLL